MTAAVVATLKNAHGGATVVLPPYCTVMSAPSTQHVIRSRSRRVAATAAVALSANG